MSSSRIRSKVTTSAGSSPDTRRVQVSVATEAKSKGTTIKTGITVEREMDGNVAEIAKDMHDAATGAQDPAMSGLAIGWRIAEMLSPTTPRPLPAPRTMRVYDVDHGDHCTHPDVPYEDAIDTFGR